MWTISLVADEGKCGGVGAWGILFSRALQVHLSSLRSPGCCALSLAQVLGDTDCDGGGLHDAGGVEFGFCKRLYPELIGADVHRIVGRARWAILAVDFFWERRSL